LIGLPQEALELLSGGFWQMATVFFRTAALVSVLPAFGERSVPVRVKLGVALAFTTIVAPAISVSAAPSGPPELLRLVFAETVIGLAFGLAVRLLVLALQVAGSMAAQSTSLSQILGGAGVEPLPAMGQVLVVSALALAVTSGLHVRAAQLLIQTYDVFPPGRLPAPGPLSAWGVGRVARAFSLAFTLAAPFVITSLLYNLTLGVINRAMPQLLVAFVGAPVITLGGLFVLYLAAPSMLAAWQIALTGFFLDPSGGIR
jgi:flagellar biosynthesis protein FliR